MENEGKWKKGGIRRESFMVWDTVHTGFFCQGLSLLQSFFPWNLGRQLQKHLELFASWTDQREFRCVERELWPQSFEGQASGKAVSGIHSTAAIPENLRGQESRRKARKWSHKKGRVEIRAERSWGCWERSADHTVEEAGKDWGQKDLGGRRPSGKGHGEEGREEWRGEPRHCLLWRFTHDK